MFLAELAQDVVAIFLQILFLFYPGSDAFGEMASHIVFFCAQTKSDFLYLAFTCSFNAIFCPVISPGFRTSSLNLTQTILLKISLSILGSQSLMFELHDNSLKGFLDTAIISSSSPQLASSNSRLYVPDEGSVCTSLS